MSWMEDLYVIYQKLDANSCQEVKKEIIKAQLNGCSDGTIYFLVLQQLVRIKREKAPVYELIRGEVESFIHAGGSSYMH